MARRPGGFEEAFGTKFQGVGDFRGRKGGAFNGGRLQRDAGFRGPREEEAHRPVAVGGMRAKEGKRIGVAGGKDSVDLRVEARIAGSDRSHVLHGWALLRQGGGLRDTEKQGIGT